MICSSSSSFYTTSFGEVKLANFLGDYQNRSLLNVGFSKPDKSALIQHIFIDINCVLDTTVRELEIQ